MKKAVMHRVAYFIGMGTRTSCGIFADIEKVTALGKVTCKNCLRTL